MGLNLLILVLITTCAANNRSNEVSEVISLDHAFINVATNMKLNIKPKTEVAIIGFEAPSSAVSNFFSVEFAKHLKNNFIVLERKMNQGVLYSDDDFALAAGHEMGARVVITGMLKQYDNFYYIRLRAIDVHSSKILSIYSARIKHDDTTLTKLMEQ